MRPWLWFSFGLLLVACGGKTAPPGTSPTTVPAGTARTLTPASGVTIVAVEGAKPGGVASATVRTQPGTSCAITYTTPDGSIAKVAGLDPKTTDASGLARWTWPIPTNTQPGIGMVDVACGGIRAATTRIIID